MKNPQRLPFEQSLFVATPNAIHSRTQLAHETLFECETANGIVNARASKDNRSLFAVADGQVVILHDATRVKDRKYKLKSGDSEPRLLLFSPDSRTLYFTTTLNNSVQAYSIPNDKILPSLPSHPSPPNAIAVSSNGTVLLSASPNPPTIYLQDQRWARSAPVDFRPTDACYPVTCAAFQKLHSLSQPSYTNFVIGFQDGSLAMYRLFLPPLRKWPDDLRTNESQFFQLQPVRIGVIKKLHKPAMSGVLAAEFIAGYKSRVVSIRHDGKCRLVDFGGGGKVLRTWNISCPATCLSVSAKGPVHSKGRVGEMVLLGDDAAEDAGDAYEGSETLIAIGTRAGKVLVFNVLGLLIHEIAVGISVTAVEWIGDMTAPSVLPTRATSLSPKHRSVVDVVDTEQSTPSEDEGSTVKKFTSLYKPAVTRKPVPVRPPPGLFSDESRKFKMKVPSRRASDVLKGSPPRGERARNRPLKKSSVQPRISTEMVQSPPNPLLQDAFCVGVAESLPKPNSTIQESRRWHQVHQMPSVPTPPRAQFFFAPHRSLSSSDDTGFSDQEWFTPPSTRRCKPKTSQRHPSPESSLIASAIMRTGPVPLGSIRHQETVVEVSNGSSIVPKAQRHVTIADRELSSPLDSSSSLYSRPTTQMLERPLLRKAQKLEMDMTPALPARPKPSISKPALRRIESETESPNSVCSCSTTGTRRDSVADESVNNIVGPSNMVPGPKASRNHALATATAADSTSSLGSLYYPAPRLLPKNNLVQNYSHRNLTSVSQRQSTFKTLDTRADSSSSVYSRSISGVAGAANHVDAGAIEDTDQSASSSNLLNPLLPYQHQLGIHVLGTPLSTSSPSRLYSPATPSMFCDGLYAVDGPSVEKAKEVGSDIVNDEARTAAEETACLAKDQRALRKEFEALREEYRVLKHVLLKPKTEVAA